MLALYELNQQYRSLVDEYSNDPDDFEAWNVLIDQLTGDIDVKVTNIAMVVKELQAEESAIADEIKRLQEKKAVRSNKIERLKSYMLEGMQLAGIEKTTDVRATVRIQKNPPSVHIIDERLIPEQYYVEVSPRLDKKSVLAAIKDGDEVPGAELTQTVGVRIK